MTFRLPQWKFEFGVRGVCESQLVHVGYMYDHIYHTDVLLLDEQLFGDAVAMNDV